MPLTTDINAIPYPEIGDVTNYPTAFSNLADSVDNRMVARFANAAARDAAITSPIAGQMCFIQKSSGAYDLQVYRAGAWADVVWGSVVLKTANESRTNTTTNSADSELLFFAQANSTYIIETRLSFINLGTDAADAKISLYLPTGATAPGSILIATPTTGTSSNNTQASFATSTNIVAGVFGIGVFNHPTVASYADFRSKVVTSSTAGNVGITWSQNAASANASTMRAGSWLRYYKVA